MLTIYGIPNCDTIKKTQTWLKNNGVEFRFHNYRTEGISAEKLKSWFAQAPIEKIVNKASTSWKALPDQVKTETITEQGFVELLTANPTIIKRPVVEDDNGKVLAVGFSEKEFEANLL